MKRTLHFILSLHRSYTELEMDALPNDIISIVISFLSGLFPELYRLSIISPRYRNLVHQQIKWKYRDQRIYTMVPTKWGALIRDELFCITPVLNVHLCMTGVLHSISPLITSKRILQLLDWVTNLKLNHITLTLEFNLNGETNKLSFKQIFFILKWNTQIQTIYIKGTLTAKMTELLMSSSKRLLKTQYSIRSIPSKAVVFLLNKMPPNYIRPPKF